MKKQDLQQIFRASGRWPARLTLTPPRPRGEGEAAAGAAGDPPAPPAIDATNPKVQELINAAVKAYQQTAAEERAGLEKNKEELLKEAKKAKEDREKLATELAEIKTKAKAGEHGVDPDKYKADVDAAAQQKFTTFAEEHKLVLADKETKLAEATAKIEQLTAENRRAWTEKNLMLAAIPESAHVVHPGAWNQLVSEMQAVIEPRKVDGVEGEVARIVVNGTLLPTTGIVASPDGMMTPAELMLLTRQGKGPLAKLSYLFVSAGQGSETKTPSHSSSTGGRKWASLSDAERGKIWGEDPEAAKKMVDADLLERQKAATPRSRAAAA